MLEITNLNKSFNEFSIKDLSLKLEPGYIMGFIGPNGAGKSTTIKLIMNLLKKDSGQIKIFNKDHIKFEKEIKDRIGFVYEEPYYYENFTIDQMKNLIGPFYSKWDDNLFKKYMEKFGIKGDQKVKNLSHGTKMKFSIGLALSHDADLIIMDEPTSGLDPVFRREILDIFYSIIQNENKSIFFSTHITTDLEKIADYITFIDKGQMVFSKTIDDVNDSYKLVKGEKESLEKIKKDLVGFRLTNLGFEGLLKSSTSLLKENYEEILIERASLEDIMYYSKEEDQW